MKVLIVYATTEGQTRKIARFMEESLQDRGHKVTIADASEEPPSPSGYDAVLVGASVHVHQYQAAIRRYIELHRDLLEKRHTAFFSVSMAMASGIENEHKEVEKLTSDFLVRTTWHPKSIYHFAGALKYTHYDYFKKLLMRLIAQREGCDTDTSKDHEYTDWKKVEKAMLDFCKTAPKKPRSVE